MFWFMIAIIENKNHLFMCSVLLTLTEVAVIFLHLHWDILFIANKAQVEIGVNCNFPESGIIFI